MCLSAVNKMFESVFPRREVYYRMKAALAVSSNILFYKVEKLHKVLGKLKQGYCVMFLCLGC